MNYILWAVFGPSTWPFWPCLLALILLRRGRERPAAFFLTLGCAAFLILAVSPLGNLILADLEAQHPPTDVDAHEFGAIAVLTGAERLNASQRTGRLEVSMHAERIMEAAALAKARPETPIYLVGGVRITEQAPRDVDWGKNYLVSAGVPAKQLIALGGSVDTCSNAAVLAEAGPTAPVLLVTSAFHMPRAVACMKRAGIAVIPYSVDFQVAPITEGTTPFSWYFHDNLKRSDLALHEYIGMALYRFQDRID